MGQTDPAGIQNPVDDTFLQQVFQSLGAAVCVLDANQRFVWVNGAFQELLGYDLVEMTGKTIEFLLADSGEENTTPSPLQITQPGQPVEVSLRKKDHDAVDTLVIAREMPTSSWTSLVITDISQQKQVERDLRSSQQILQLVLDNIPQAVFWKDRDSVYTFCNRNFSFDAGVGAPENIMGKTDLDLAWHRDEAEAFIDWDQQVMEGNVPAYHIIEPQFQSDGKQAWLDTNKVPLHDLAGNVVGILGTYEDITERKQAEEALHASQQMLRLVMDNIPQAVFWKDRDLVYLGCNRNFALDAGMGSPEQMIGKTDFDLAWRREEAEAFRAWDTRVMEEDVPVYHLIETQVQADGKQAWLDTNKVPLHDAEGNVVGVLGTYEDITERKLAEEALQRAHDNLEIRVKERTAELSDSNQQLRLEIAERERMEQALGRRDAILEALAYASQRLLNFGDRDEALLDVLSQLGRAVGVTHAALYQNLEVEGDLHASLTCEWHAMGDGGIEPLKEFAYVESGLGRWAAVMTDVLPLYGAMKDFLPGEWAFFHKREIRSIAMLPIFSNGGWWGFLEFDDHTSQRTWLSVEIEALKSATGALGAAFAQQRAIQAEREQRALADSLRETSALLNSTLMLEEVLDRILSEIGRVVPHDMANIIFVEGDDARTVRYHHTHLSDGLQVESTLAYKLTERPNLAHMIETRQTLVVQDVTNRPDWVDLPRTRWVRSYIGSPIIIDGQVIGFINLNSATAGFFTIPHGERLQAFADQAAIAIKNARLYERAQELAAVEERQRLARDLHDAVSQTLWTASLIADVLPSMWERDAQEFRASLEKLRQLTRGALAEMRSLLLELRPAALAEAQLDDLLHQLAEAAMSRKRIDIQITTQGQCTISREVKVAYYRIAQEGLNNIVKHSHATQVDILLECSDKSLRLVMRDNGRGFEPEKVSAERLGLGILRERAESINAHLELISEPGAGTELTVTWREVDG